MHSTSNTPFRIFWLGLLVLAVWAINVHADSSPQTTTSTTTINQSACCGKRCGNGCGKQAGRGHGRRWQGGRNQATTPDGPTTAGLTIADVRPVFHNLLDEHLKIERVVEEIPGGIRSETTSADPVVATKIRLHAHQMEQWLKQGDPIRRWDPLFEAIIANSGKISLQIEDIPGGVRVTETSSEAHVTGLIRAHAKAVSGFVAEGYDAAHRAHPVPASIEAKHN